MAKTEGLGAIEGTDASTSGEPGPGQTLGRYVVLGTLGRGGMGTVLSAFDPSLDRRVALKVLHAELDRRHTTRLRREALALAKLSHPNVVQVYEVGDVGGRTFVAMELVEGATLDQWMHRDPRPSWRECVEVFVQAGSGLAAAHAEGLVHRDFKPSNAIIDAQGRPRVLDFGLARRTNADAQPEEPLGESPRSAASMSGPIDLDVSVTKTGSMLGTPAYMSPEQIVGREVDERSDQFSFCVSLYEAVYGTRPFTGSNAKSMVASMRSVATRSGVPSSRETARLHKVLMRGLSFESRERWPSMEALLEQLRELIAPRSPRWLALSLAAGLVALGLGVGLPQYARWADRCSGSSAQLVGIWDDARRSEVEAALRRTALPYASDSWERVAAGLDGYAKAWIEQHTETCEATAVRAEQSDEVMSLRMDCLRDHREGMDAVVTVLAQADARVVQHAIDLVDGLPSLARCSDVRRLTEERQRLPPPQDPEVAREVEALREELRGAHARWTAGDYDDSLARADAVVARAERLDYEPLAAEALVERAYARVELAHPAEAEQDLERAYRLAARHGHDSVTAESVRALVYVVGLDPERHAAALQWGKVALALAQGPGSDPGDQSVVLDYIGDVLVRQGRYDEALARFRRSMSLREKTPDVREIDLAESHTRIADALRTLGELDEARAGFLRALDIAERARGPRHPRVASALTNLGIVLRSLGDDDLALAHHRRALEIWEQTLGSDHLSVALSHNNIGLVLADRGELEKALVHHQQALAAFEETLGADHPHVASSLGNLGIVYAEQGKYDDALPYYRRALAIVERAHGTGHYQVGELTYNIARALGLLGRREEARAHLDRALTVFESALAPDHPSVARVLEEMARMDLAEGQLDAARDHAERALAVREARGFDDEVLAASRFMLARALWPHEAERPRARTLAEQAREGYAMTGDDESRMKVDAWLHEVGRVD